MSAMAVAGLSPRVRGSPGAPPAQDQRGGSIPACAGEPHRPGSTGTTSGVYPRVCGGAPHGGCHEACKGGSIPACAGEPSQAQGSTCHVRVYPRVCGGAALGLFPFFHSKGLSPRVRGSRLNRHLDSDVTGSIPACAGEPRLFLRRRGGSRVYPRVCGGAGAPPAVAVDHAGLSPRVRGSPNLVQGLS